MIKADSRMPKRIGFVKEYFLRKKDHKRKKNFEDFDRSFRPVRKLSRFNEPIYKTGRHFPG